MTQKLTAEEVRAFRNITFAPSDPGYAITSAFADCIEADESAVPFGYYYQDSLTKPYFTAAEDRQPIGWRAGEIPLFTHPPAQAAQVDSEGKPLIEVTQEDANNYCRILSLLGLEEEGDPVAEVGLLIAARDAEPVAQGDDVCVPFEQLSELMRGLELGPASAYLSPHALYCIGRAIASQAKEATHPHSPDAADSGRVGDISRLTRYFPSMPSHPGWQMSPDPRGEWVLFADVQALAAQGQGDRDAYEGARRDLLDWKHRALSAESILRSLGYRGIVPVEPPASPAGVPDVRLNELAGQWDELANAAYADGELDRRDVWREAAHRLRKLAAAPSAPEGDGGGE